MSVNGVNGVNRKEARLKNELNLHDGATIHRIESRTIEAVAGPGAA